MKKKILIIGANKGLGKSILEYYQVKKDIVYYTTRNVNKTDNFQKCLDLNNLKNLKNFKFNKIKFKYIFFVAALTPNYNKSIEKKSHFGSIEEGEFIKYHKVNCFSPIKIFEHISKNNYLCNDAKIFFFSSIASSISLRGKLKHNKRKGNLLYRLSKSSLNCAVKNLAYDFSNTKKSFISIHPGWVKTNSGGSKADLEINEATKKIVKLVETINKKDSGKFLDLNGKELEW